MLVYKQQHTEWKCVFIKRQSWCPHLERCGGYFERNMYFNMFICVATEKHHKKGISSFSSDYLQGGSGNSRQMFASYFRPFCFVWFLLLKAYGCFYHLKKKKPSPEFCFSFSISVTRKWFRYKDFFSHRHSFTLMKFIDVPTAH